MDGESILPWFDHRIADEMRLWHAVERQYLVPFDYYGVHDGTDLSGIAWTRGSYAVGELERRYIGNSRRANLIITEVWETYGDWRQARALGFCVSIAHTEFMAQAFRDAGIPCSSHHQRISCRRKIAGRIDASQPHGQCSIHCRSFQRGCGHPRGRLRTVLGGRQKVRRCSSSSWAAAFDSIPARPVV
jgi:hypothetical protein